MIGKIRGRVDYTAKDYVLIDVNGVGYLVYCADYTLGSVAEYWRDGRALYRFNRARG